MTQNEQLNKMFELVNRGEVDKAYNGFAHFIKNNPDNEDGLFGLALSSYYKKEHAACEKYLNKVLRISKGRYLYDVLLLLGILSQQKKQYTKAINHLTKALAINQYSDDCLNRLGFVYELIGNLDKAGEYYTQALEIKPQHLQYLLNAASIKVKKGQHDAALQSYESIYKHYPNNINVIVNIANLASQLHKKNKAKSYLKRAISFNKENHVLYNLLANIYNEEKKYTKAEQNYQKALSLKNDYPEYLHNLGLVYESKGNLSLAYQYFNKVHRLEPTALAPIKNMANVCFKRCQFNKALKLIKIALKIDCQDVDALHLKGKIEKELCLYDEAKKSFNKILSIVPKHQASIYELSTIALLHGELQQGFNQYQSRYYLGWFKNTDLPLDQIYPGKEWDGKSSLKDKSLLILHEQGLGDYIQFIRYINQLDKSCKVYTKCPPSLTHIIDSSFDIKGFQYKNDEIDYFIPVMSLPSVFNTTLDTVPSEVPYLSVKNSHIKQAAKHFNKKKFNVLIEWAGNPLHLSDQLRSIKLKYFLPILNTANTQFYHIHFNDSDSLIDSAHITDLTNYVKTFYDSACILMNVDLVITVDTAIAHLAGALNRPCWLLVAKNPEWRWQLQRQDSCWYPSLKIYRQQKLKDWSGIVNKVSEDLQKLAREVIDGR